MRDVIPVARDVIPVPCDVIPVPRNAIRVARDGGSFEVVLFMDILQQERVSE